MTTIAALATAYAIASRLAYVGWVGWALRHQESERYFTAAVGIDAGFRRFRRLTTLVMRNDAMALVIVFVVTRDTLSIGIPAVLRLSLAAILIFLGLGSKLWAARTLGDDAYYWHNFFAPERHTAPDPPGPYRYIRNPMYTIGYLHAWGLALAFASAPGLAVTCFAQVAILAFHFLVEKPHYERLTAAA